MKKFKTTAAIAATAMMLSICMCGCGMDETSKDNATTSEQTQITTQLAEMQQIPMALEMESKMPRTVSAKVSRTLQKALAKASRMLPKVSEMVSRMLWTAWKMP